MRSYTISSLSPGTDYTIKLAAFVEYDGVTKVGNELSEYYSTYPEAPSSKLLFKGVFFYVFRISGLSLLELIVRLVKRPYAPHVISKKILIRSNMLVLCHG